MKRLATLSLLLLAPLPVLVPAHARAQGTSAAAQALYDQGKSLMAAGKANEACPKFEESQRLDPGSGTLINLALCYEETGRLASAWSTYQEAAAAARTVGNTDRERVAREHAAALASKVSKLTIEVPADVRIEGLSITRDGVEVGPAQWGVPIPTDAGNHDVRAKAPGHEDWHQSVSVAGNAATASVTVPALSAASASPPPEPAATPVASTPAAQSHGLGTQRVLALVTGGVGIAGVAVGGVFGVQAMSKKSDADKVCDGASCTTNDGVTAGNDAHQAGTISTISMVAGGVLLAGGIVLWVTAPKHAASVGVAPNGLFLRGNF